MNLAVMIKEMQGLGYGLLMRVQEFVKILSLKRYQKARCLET